MITGYSFSARVRRRAAQGRWIGPPGADPKTAKVHFAQLGRRQLADVAMVVLNDDGCLQVGGICFMRSIEATVARGRS